MCTKICKTCLDEKDLDDFPREMRQGNWYFLLHCKCCTKKKKAQTKQLYRENNKEKLYNDKKNWYQTNRQRILLKNSKYKKNNREKYNTNYAKRVKNEPEFKLNELIRSMIKQAMRGTKNKSSISNYLNYSMQDLRNHLEKRFEHWMNWNNHGKYNSKIWNDNDSSTWTWQIDHIIPQSQLPYTSMEEDNFKKCWSLENLRPYSAKQNLLDGSNRIRHRKLS